VSYTIDVGSWVVIRDKSSANDGVHGSVVSIEGETATVRTSLGYLPVPLSTLAIPVDGTDPSIRAALEKLDQSGRDLHVKFDEAVVRIAAENAKKLTGYELPDEVKALLGPILQIVEIAVAVL
jgi:hypothetical protein